MLQYVGALTGYESTVNTVDGEAERRVTPDRLGPTSADGPGRMGLFLRNDRERSDDTLMPLKESNTRGRDGDRWGWG